MNTSPYIQTSRGGTVDLIHPDPGTLVLPVMARAISFINRYTGHAGLYSVAQHLCHCHDVLADEGQSVGVIKGALLHDLHEANFGDMSSPMKKAIELFYGLDLHVLEHVHIGAVEQRFGVRIFHPKVAEVDMRMCVTEADQLLGGRVGPGWPNAAPYDHIRITPWDPARAEREFLARCHRLDIR